MRFYVLLISVGMMVITCTKKESSDSVTRPTDTIKSTVNDSVKTKKDSMAVTYERITEEEYNTIIADYDTNFNSTSLARKNFEIDKDSFNSTIASNSKKEYLDIYFVLDENNDNNLVFKFCDNVDMKPDYQLNSEEHQYILRGKKLALADDLILKDLVENFKEKYKDHFGLLKGGKHTIYVRDVISTIPITNNDLVLKPCLNNLREVSLATIINGSYYNRGALWP